MTERPDKSERKYEDIFNNVAVSILEEDISEVRKAIDDLKAQGVSDFKKYLDENPDFVHRGSRMIKIIDANDAALKLYGAKSKAELLGSLDKVFAQQSYDVLKQELIAIAEGMEFFEAEDVNFNLRGEHIDIWLHASIPPENAEFKSRLVSIVDITERKKAENRLYLQYGIIRILAESGEVPDTMQKILQAVCKDIGCEIGEIWFVDNKTNTLRLCSIWHKPEWKGSEFVEISKKFTFEKGKGLPGRVWENGQPACITDVTTDETFPRLSIAHKAKLHGAFAFPIKSSGNVTGVMDFFSRDIKTPDNDLLLMLDALGNQIGGFIERRQAEERLLKEKVFSQSLIDSLPGTVCLFDEKGNILRWNINLEYVTKYSAEEIKKMNPLDFIADKDKEYVVQRIQEVFIKGTSKAEANLLTKNGKGIPYYFTGLRIIINNATCLLSVGLDITERKQMEERLHRYEYIVSSSDEHMSLIDRNYVYQSVNNSYLKAFNKRRDEIEGHSVAELFGTQTFEKTIKNYLDLCLNGETINYQSWFDFLGLGQRFMDVFYYPFYRVEGSVSCVVVISRDITEHKKAEDELQKIYDSLTEAQRISHIGNWDWDIQKNRAFCSDEVDSIFGFKPGGFGRTLESLIRTVHPYDRELVEKKFHEALYEGKPFDFERRVVRPDGTVRIVHERGQVVFDEAGKPLRMVGTLQDITVRKQMEAELEKIHKLESVGILAGGIAHDFNNLLTAILGNISLAKMHMRPDDKDFVRLTDAENACLQATELSNRLITFSKGGEPFRRTISINKMVDETVCSALSGTNISCECKLPPDLNPVYADEGQLRQCLRNMVINAREAMPDGGVLRVGAENVTVNESQVSGLNAGKYVKISVQDTGRGIPEDGLPKIFDPYFTTKEMGAQRGLGLGLAVCYSIIKKHDGHISAESKIEGGTTFQIYLPAVEAEIKGPATANAQVLGKKRVLIMDDEAFVRDVAGRILEHLGYEVEYAGDGHEAVERYKKAKESGKVFDAVILDLTVHGGMGGDWAIRKLVEADPQVKALVSSGYADNPVMTSFKEYGFAGAIPKPYNVLQLKEALEKALAE